jgi:Domain of unknown function (DUF4252)
MKIVTIVLATGLIPAWGQEIKLPANLEKLGEKAEHSVNVTLEGTMLRLAGRFLSDKDSDTAKARSVFAGLESVHVRSFEFAREGEYNMAEVDAVRAQLQSPAWSRMVGVRSKRINGDSGDADVYVKIAGNGQFGGVVVISAEPKELTIVTIVGTLDPQHLAELGGKLHIPELAFSLGVTNRRRGSR